jgi:hypothetical protein
MDNIDVEGIMLPNVPLSNIQLEDAVKRLNIPNFRGCYCIDTLPKICHRADSGILNHDNSRGDGTHWTAWYVAGQAREGDNNNKIYFDSYGIDPPLELIKYLGPSIYCSTESIQPIDTVVCGHLCLYVLKKLSDGMEYI